MTNISRYAVIFLLAVGIALGNAPATAAGIAGNALRFDGGDDEVGDFVNIPHDPSLSVSPYTVEAWVFLEDGDFEEMQVLSKGANFGNYTLDVFGDGNEISGLRGDAGLSHRCADSEACSARRVSSSDAAPRIAFGGWTHVAGTFDGTALRIYVNGGLANEFLVDDEPAQSMSALFIGRADFGSGEFLFREFFRGTVDEVRIWNVARTPEQIAAHFNRVVGPTTPGLVANYHFDEGFFENDDVLFPVQEVFDSAAKPDGVDPNDGTLGADEFADDDDPERVDSTAPLVGGVAECPFEETSAVCVEGTEDNVVIFYGPEPAFNVGPARCTCSDQVSVEECSPDASGPNPCFPEGNEVISSTVLEIVTTETNPTCKKVCYDSDGIRICEKICQ